MTRPPGTPRPGGSRLVIVQGEPKASEEQRRELEARFPGWEIWFTGCAWCARPRPHIIADSAEDLAERIRIAHSQPPGGSPPLASWRSYLARARQFREFERAAAETWQRMRAEADRWRRFPFRQRARRPAADEAEPVVAMPPVSEGAPPPDIIA